MKTSPSEIQDEPTVLIHGNPWKVKDVAEEVANLVKEDWHREIWKPAPALIHKKGGVSTQYRGQKFDPEKIDLVPDGWDHDHCAICWWTLHETGDEDEGIGYRNESNVWLCVECFRLFIESDILKIKKQSEHDSGLKGLQP
jgi:hypothetical protein